MRGWGRCQWDWGSEEPQAWKGYMYLRNSGVGGGGHQGLWEHGEPGRLQATDTACLVQASRHCVETMWGLRAEARGQGEGTSGDAQMKAEAFASCS